MTNISIGSSTDLGKRETNEDSVLAILAQDPGNTISPDSTPMAGASALLVLADGMGGRAKGQLASRTAVKIVYRELAHILAMRTNTDREYLENSLTNALRQANAKIKDIGEGSPEADGMGTTCTVGVITRGMLSLAHVGDTRAYLVRPGQKIEALTEDHSVVAGEIRAGRLTEDEARKSKFRNVITRAVGVEENVNVDVQTFSLVPGELTQIILSSDGLHGMVEPDRIEEIVRTAATPQLAADALVSEAKANDAKDNISVIVARIESDGSEVVETPMLRRRRKARLPGNILAFVLGLALAAISAWLAVPGLVAPKTLIVPVTEPSKQEQNPIIDLKNVTYAAPKPLLGRKVAYPVLIKAGDNMIVVDPDARRVLQVQPDGKVLTSVPDRAQLSATSPHSVYWASDNQGNLYESEPNSQIIRKFDADGQFLRTVGQGVLSDPQALTVAANGDVYVIDNGTLKLIQAVPAAPGQPAPTSTKPSGAGSPAAPVSGT